ncbi:hypothetical protein EV360DRAFT_76362 [Lentinula raphanica]|nr:hypothetical protein EV360DRAFT_76362 [Lentinula raphanica]
MRFSLVLLLGLASATYGLPKPVTPFQGSSFRPTVAANRAPPPTVATQAPSPTVATQAPSPTVATQAPSPAIAQATPPATETFTITYWFRPVLEWEMPAEVESELGPTTREESQKWTRDLISRIFRSMGLDPPINNQEKVKFMGDAQNWHFQLSTFDVVLLKDKDGWRVAAETTETDDTVIRVWGMSMVNVIASDRHGVKENQVIFQEWDDITNRFRTVAQFRIPWNEQDEKMVREFREATARALCKRRARLRNKREAETAVGFWRVTEMLIIGVSVMQKKLWMLWGGVSEDFRARNIFPDGGSRRPRKSRSDNLKMPNSGNSPPPFSSTSFYPQSPGQRTIKYLPIHQPHTQICLSTRGLAQGVAPTKYWFGANQLRCGTACQSVFKAIQLIDWRSDTAGGMNISFFAMATGESSICNLHGLLFIWHRRSQSFVLDPDLATALAGRRRHRTSFSESGIPLKQIAIVSYAKWPHIRDPRRFLKDALIFRAYPLPPGGHGLPGTESGRPNMGEGLEESVPRDIFKAGMPCQIKLDLHCIDTDSLNVQTNKQPTYSRLQSNAKLPHSKQTRIRKLPLLWKWINWIHAVQAQIATQDLSGLYYRLLYKTTVRGPIFFFISAGLSQRPFDFNLKKIPGWPWKYLSVLVCTLDAFFAFFDFLHRLYLRSSLLLSWIAESLIIVFSRRSSIFFKSCSFTIINFCQRFLERFLAPNPLRLYPTNSMRFNIVLLLGLVSATCALPNPGLRHFQPRSDPDAGAQPTVGNHTSGLTRCADSAAHTSNPAEGSAGTTAPYFVKGHTSGPRYNILASNDPSRGITLMIQANPEYAADLAVWSVQVISRIFEPHEVFPHLLLLDTPVPRPLPIHEPHHWYYEIMSKDMAVVINKATAQLVGWMPVAEASSLHDSNLVVVKTPVIGSISVLGPLDRVKVQGAFCDNERREIVGTSFSMPERKHFMQLLGKSDREMMETFQTLSRGSLDQTHS